ncbi:MAG: 5-(carboxyamino)imidazole ribonucleotide synthase [Burkholderiaceae bacterium]|nr:5-(carboxyamino)imidazole ribonucleotide synthase [Burkholderiaceae bacterium]
MSASSSRHSVEPVQPGQWLGLVGGGQLGRMFCHAAQGMGFKVAVLDPASEGPAASVADLHIQADYDDAEGLRQLGERCLAVTTEFENVPAASLRALANHCRVSPAADAVAIVQDRNTEKAFIVAQGIAVAPNAPVYTRADIEAADASLFPGILKVARLGYDGKGQARVATRDQALAAFDAFDGQVCVLEAMLPLDDELSVVIARGFDGQATVFPIARNEHIDGILARSTVGAEGDDTYTQAATVAALAIVNGLDYHGVLCVEFFVTTDGRLVVNEIAPRPHNSGHYSMDACATSQFEQQARAMAGLPLGSTRLLAPAVMLNILGDVWFEPGSDSTRDPAWHDVLAVEEAKLHLYGKAQARRARKMGHVNCTGATLEKAQAAAERVAAVLGLKLD